MANTPDRVDAGGDWHAISIATLSEHRPLMNRADGARVDCVRCEVDHAPPCIAQTWLRRTRSISLTTSEDAVVDVCVTAPGMAIPLTTVCALLIAMAVKHFGADFIGQTQWMVQGKESPTGWGLPLAAHAGCHGLGTLCIALAYKPALWWVCLVDLVLHGLIDRGKGVIAHHARFGTEDPRFWWLLGFDQLLHQLTNILLVALLLAG